MSDKPVCLDMISGLHSETIKKIHHYMVSDPDTMIRDYMIAQKKDFSSYVYPVHRYRKTPPEERLKLVDIFLSIDFRSSNLIYSKRSSIEPLIEHIKSVFRIDPVPIRGDI